MREGGEEEAWEDFARGGGFCSLSFAVFPLPAAMKASALSRFVLPFRLRTAGNRIMPIYSCWHQLAAAADQTLALGRRPLPRECDTARQEVTFVLASGGWVSAGASKMTPKWTEE